MHASSTCILARIMYTDKYRHTGTRGHMPTLMPTRMHIDTRTCACRKHKHTCSCALSCAYTHTQTHTRMRAHNTQTQTQAHTFTRHIHVLTLRMHVHVHTCSHKQTHRTVHPHTYSIMPSPFSSLRADSRNATCRGSSYFPPVL